MYLSCCGINHHTSSLHDRECLQISRDKIPRVVREYKLLAKASEAAVISTCNRIEFYRVDPQKIDIRSSVIEYYRGRDDRIVNTLNRTLFVRQGTSAARHLFKVASGLDSALLGEYQIIGQVKEAYSEACSVDGPGKILHKLFHHAFQISKRIRSETDIGKGAQGLAGASIDLVRDIFDGDLNNLHVVVVGVNSSTEMLLKRLQKENVRVTLSNRSLDKADKLSRVYNIEICPLGDITSALKSADVFFSATSKDGYILEKKHLDHSFPDNKKFVAIDLAIPRDIDPSISELPEVTLLDLDDLKRYLDNVANDRTVELPYALDLIDEQVSLFEQWRRKANGVDNSELRQLLNEDRHQVLDRFQDNFKQGEYKALDAFSRAMFKQFLRRINSTDTD